MHGDAIQQSSLPKVQMEGTITTSCYDVVVIRHRNQTLKSTPFQAVFAEKSYKRDPRKTKLRLIVNEEPIDIPMRIDPANGRVQFQKKYTRKVGTISDSSDISDDEISQRSTSREKRISATLKGETLEGLKNEQAPKNFWQFAWLFSSKRGEAPPKPKPEEESTGEQSKLARIKQQPYEGEESSKEPLFQLSLCGHLLAKKKETSKEELERIFYANKIEYREFIKDPLALINDANLIVRIDNSLYTWQLGAAVLACKFAFGEEPDRLVDAAIAAKNKKSWFAIFGRDNVTKLDIEKEPAVAFPAPVRPEEGQEIIRYRKTPDHQLLARMNLKVGENQAKFVLQVSPGVTEEAEFQIFLWQEDEKVVISDIDGTITKSDVMGQLKTNYIHKGVCLLYNELAKRNYKLLYMTARAINQYGQTKKFLRKEVEENGKNLPPGPLLMSPDGYIKSFAREVIDKTPDQLKIKLLASVNQIFPSSKKPIIAGFGNRETDSIAYLRIQIPQDRIFCISEKSLITNYSDQNFQTTYPDMLEHIDDFFPPLSNPNTSEASTNKDRGVPIDDNEEEVLKNHRKLSHSEFYQRSPVSTERIDILSMSSRSHSEDANEDNNRDLEVLAQEYMASELQKKKQ